jgi:hypothetical protein
MTPRASASSRPDMRLDKRTDDLEQQRLALVERARELGATAEELGAELEALALQAEAVLHRLRNGRVH